MKECAVGNREICFWQGKQAEIVLILILMSGFAVFICLWLLVLPIQTTRLIIFFTLHSSVCLEKGSETSEQLFVYRGINTLYSWSRWSEPFSRHTLYITCLYKIKFYNFTNAVQYFVKNWSFSVKDPSTLTGC